MTSLISVIMPYYKKKTICEKVNRVSSESNLLEF